MRLCRRAEKFLLFKRTEQLFGVEHSWQRPGPDLFCGLLVPQDAASRSKGIRKQLAGRGARRRSFVLGKPANRPPISRQHRHAKLDQRDRQRSLENSPISHFGYAESNSRPNFGSKQQLEEMPSSGATPRPASLEMLRDHLHHHWEDW